MSEMIIVALIGAAGVSLAAILPAILVQMSRRENNRDHADVSRRLEGIDSHLGVVEAKVDHVQYGLATHLLKHQREELHDGDNGGDQR
jgi:hypothetical protein